MTLKLVYDSLDDVPESLREEVEESDGGKFRLKVEGVKTEEEIAGLSKTMKEERRQRQQLEKQLKELQKKVPEDFDPEEYERLKRLAEEHDIDPEGDPDDPDPDDPDDLDDPDGKKKSLRGGKLTDDQMRRRMKLRIKNQLEKHWTEKLRQKEQREGQLTKEIQRLLVDNGLTNALAKVGVSKHYLKAAKAMLRDQVKIVEDDGKFKAVIEGELGEMELEEFVKDWAETEEGSAYIAAKLNSGGGSPPGGSNDGRRQVKPNPFKRETWNLTEQARLKKSSPEEYARLKTEAGRK